VVNNDAHAELQMNHVEVAPVPSEILKREATVAMLRRRIAAEEGGWDVEQSPVNVAFYSPRCHQLEKPLFVLMPLQFFLAITGEQVRCRSQRGLVEIFYAADFPQKIPEIVSFREPGELGGVVAPDVDQPPYPDLA
jgi:hypothetical protein